MQTDLRQVQLVSFQVEASVPRAKHWICEYQKVDMWDQKNKTEQKQKETTKEHTTQKKVKNLGKLEKFLFPTFSALLHSGNFENFLNTNRTIKIAAATCNQTYGISWNQIWTLRSLHSDENDIIAYPFILGYTM